MCFEKIGAYLLELNLTIHIQLIKFIQRQFWFENLSQLYVVYATLPLLP